MCGHIVSYFLGRSWKLRLEARLDAAVEEQPLSCRYLSRPDKNSQKNWQALSLEYQSMRAALPKLQHVCGSANHPENFHRIQD